MAAEKENQRYEIRLRGHIGERTLLAFPGFHADTQSGDTVLTGPVPDQAGLYGVLAAIETLGLELLEVRRLPQPT